MIRIILLALGRAHVDAWACALCFALTLAPLRAAADEGRSFRANVAVEVPLLAVGTAAWIASEALKPVLTRERCRWCEASPWEESLHERLRWSSPRAAARFSDALLFGIVPAAAFASVVALARAHDDRHAARVDALGVGEALVLTSVLTQLTKFTVLRERPRASASRAEPNVRQGPDDRLSFFSGHTSATFALVAAAGTTASLRGHREAPLVWAIGLPLAAFTGYLRMAGERHYFTDVLTGALVGCAVGALVAWLHAREREPIDSP